MTGFVLLRVRAHRLLLSAALLAVLLTTCVLSALTAFSGSMGDAALRHTLTHRSAERAALFVSADVERGERAEADSAVRRAARDTFDGLPVTVRKLESSGPYALPRELRVPAARRDQPDLTHLASLDRSRVRLVAGRMPDTGAGGAQDPVQVALPRTAAEALKLEPGSRVTLTDRLAETPLPVEITGLYEPSDLDDPYWRLDPLGGRGVRKVVFTTYGPLLADPAVLGSGRVGDGPVSWLAAADFRTVTTGRTDALHRASTDGPKELSASALFGDGATVRTSLPTVIDQVGRALLVSRSTIMIVAVQLVLLAGYALLLVARLLSSERDGETELLRARGGSRGRIAALAAVEALLLAVPAAAVAPLLAGPLTRLLADRSALGRIGLRLDGGVDGTVWLVAGGVALACALAVVAPALAAGARERRGARAAALPTPVRAGADIGLLLIAGVAYWQLDRQTGASAGGALSGDREGELGIDPLLVAAPALALLAGTVLTLRLLPPAARLAERRAAGGRGLSAALAGWQFSRRPLRGAGPVLLLVLSVAMGMLAIGQSATWDRSQGDQADFRSGASVRVVGTLSGDPAKAAAYTGLPGVREAAPAFRTTADLSGGRTAEVLALDTAHADERMLMREDLSGTSPQGLFDAIAPRSTTRTGVVLPQDSEQVLFDVRVRDTSASGGKSPSGSTGLVSVLLEDRYGIGYRVGAGSVPVDGRTHSLSFPVSASGELAVTGFELDSDVPEGRAETRVVSLTGLRAVTAGGDERPATAAGGVRWQAKATMAAAGEEQAAEPPVAVTGSGASPAFQYETGHTAADDGYYGDPVSTLRVTAARPAAPALKAVATDAYLTYAGAKPGQEVDLTLAGNTVRVTLVKSVRELPTTGPGAVSGAPEGASEDVSTKPGGGLLLDLRAVSEVLAHREGAALAPTEWWLSTAPGDGAEVAAALRALPGTDPAQVRVRDEVARELADDPLGAGPQAALLAVAVVAAALAAVGFAVGLVGSQRERSAEFAVLRALGTPRRRMARMTAAEQGVLITLALLIGLALGAALTRAVVPLVVLTGQAARPVPDVLVLLPAGQVAVLLASVAALPLLIVAALTLRRADPAVSLRHQGDN
ncbi:FtsX-like permease family protein [Streptomyces sp. JH34]|uniref:FtsX-like permease family protein n=1 Tax=Streptomyces sp. JH34 TaxID=2793633 RepID=UPI0023FA1DCF|nr:FtsX-like permease family protein [Streptomyces sp. JH34]MDF6021095.1 FtsX-like permease family protein [Streptomyces sp. JH34]